MGILVTTRPDVPNRCVVEVIGIVLGEGDALRDAYVALEEMAEAAEADAVVDVRTTAVGAGDGVHRALIRWGAIGTAVRLAPRRRRRERVEER